MEKYIAITFDDGPHPVHTVRLLEELKKREAKGTFFVLGQEVEEYPEILRQIVAEGHEVGNHSFTHPHLSELLALEIYQEIQCCQNSIEKIIGQKPRIFRPPFGDINETLLGICQQMDKALVMWSADAQDWRVNDVDLIVENVLAGELDFGIILMHDVHEHSVDAACIIMDKLCAQGYKFETVSRLFELAGKELTSGLVVGKA